MSQFWPAPPPQSGEAVLPTVAAGGVSAAVPIVFDPPFAVPPKVVVSVSNVRLTPSASNVTGAGADLFVANWTPSGAAAGVILRWVAMP